MASAVKRFPLVGYDTLTNLQSGVIQGMAAEIDGIIHAYRGRYNELQVLITGGDLFFFDSLLLHPMHGDPYLLFRGLQAICETNLPG